MLTEIDADSLAHVLTCVHRHARFSSHPPQSSLDQFLLTLKPGDVLEIQGPPASAKTHLLYYILANVILPSTYQGVPIGGWGKAAIVFDTDSTFDVARLVQIIMNHLHFRLTPAALETDPTAFVRTSLKRLHIFSPSSSAQLAVTISGLPEYHKTNLATEQIALLAIDSISAYYWPDKYRGEQIPKESAPLQRIRDSLDTFRRAHGNITVLTSWNIQQDTSSRNLIRRTQTKVSSPEAPSRANVNRVPVPFLHYHLTLRSDDPPDAQQEEMVAEDNIKESKGMPRSKNNFEGVIKAFQAAGEDDKTIHFDVTLQGLVGVS